MKHLFAMAAFVSLAHLPAHAAAFSSVNLQPGQPAAPAHLMPATFPEPVAINPASAVIALENATIFIDPVGDQAQYSRFGRPDIVVLTRAHPDHLSIDTMIGMLRRDTIVLAPQAVIDQLPLMISNNVITPFNAGATQEALGITFQALSAVADIPSDAQVYPRPRADIGVVIEVDGARVYF